MPPFAESLPPFSRSSSICASVALGERDAAVLQDDRRRAVRAAEHDVAVVVEGRAEHGTHAYDVALHRHRQRQLAADYGKRGIVCSATLLVGVTAAAELRERFGREVLAPAADVLERGRVEPEERERHTRRHVAGLLQHGRGLPGV